jgi:hypothetical protein
MKKFKFLTGVIFLISVFVLVGLVGKAHALAWWGFSKLCYEAQFKGSPDTEIEINVVNLKVQAGCLNIKDNSIDCKSGEGNSGSFPIVAIPTSINSDKDKNIVYINGCIDLSKYDNHDLDGHQHICYPYDNPNKVEIIDSAYVSTIDVYYDVINTNNNQIKYSAHQICHYPGQIDPTTCEPPHYETNDPNSKVYFICSEEEIINK